MNVPDKINPYPGKESLNEAYQQTGLRYTFLSPPRADNTACSPFMKCKDYLHDMVRAQLTKGTAQIFGLNYRAGESPVVDMRRLRMIFREEGKNCYQLAASLTKGLSLIRQAEKIAGVSGRTNYGVYADEGEQYVVVSSPNFWLKSPVLTSLYPLLIRLGTHSSMVDNPLIETAFDDFKGSDKDAGFAKEIKDKIVVLLKNYSALLDIDKSGYDPVIFQEGVNIESYHNNAGVISFFRGQGLYKNRKADLDSLLEKYMKEKEELESAPSVVYPGQIQQGPYYSPTSISYGFLAPPTGESNKYTLAGGFNTCRESMNYVVAPKLKDGTLPKDKLRMMLWCPGTEADSERQTIFETALLTAKRVINAIEKEFGLKRSTVKRMRMEGHKGSSTYQWMWVGSPVWITSPVAMNILVTLTRSLVKYVTNKETIPEKITYESFKETMLPIITSKEVWVKPYEVDVWKKWDSVEVLLRNWKSTLRTSDMPQHYCFDHKNFTGLYTNVGFSSLLKGNSPDTVLTGKFQKLLKENKESTATL